MYIGDAQAGKIYLGDVLISGGDSNGYLLGEATAESTAAGLTITDLGNWRGNAQGLVETLQDLWDWDDEDALTWGCFTLYRTGSSGIAVKDSYSENTNLYGGEWNVAANTSDSVSIVKNDKYMMLDMPGGALVFFTALDGDGNAHKCVAGAKNLSSYYRIYYGADDGTGANPYKLETNNTNWLTTAIYEMTPFFDEISGGYVQTADVMIVRRYPSIINGLYSVGGEQIYFGNFIAIKDV